MPEGALTTKIWALNRPVWFSGGTAARPHHCRALEERGVEGLNLSRASAFETGVVFKHSGEGTGARSMLYVARPGEEFASAESTRPLIVKPEPLMRPSISGCLHPP